MVLQILQHNKPCLFICINYKAMGFLINIDDKALICILLSLEMRAFLIEISMEK